ncbi:MAG TPA: HAMP domain-containing sensor histidine kinase [Candidatus Saccharimonadales bacterium]
MSLKAEKQTLRLAATYLGVMLLVSVVFSVMFYITSANALHLSTAHYEAPNIPHNGQQLPTKPRPMMTPQSQTALLKHRLAVRLTLLNAGVLIVGGIMSWYLAGRTLRPMRRAMDIQQQFFFDASHELKTPLAALHLRSDVTLRNRGLTLAGAKAALVSNVEQVVKLERLTGDLLQLAKADNAVTNLNPVPLSTAANLAAEQLSDAAAAKSIHLITNVGDIYAQSNLQQLVQIVVILLDNAIKYSPSNTSIYLESRSSKKEVTLRVRDEGPGVDSVDLPHIFERFYQGDQSRHREGSGLGLSIAATIVRELHGSIHVSSSPDGSIFSIVLPPAH